MQRLLYYKKMSEENQIKESEENKKQEYDSVKITQKECFILYRARFIVKKSKIINTTLA